MSQELDLPLAVVVLADLTGKPEEELPLLQKRMCLPIDANNFDERLKACKPRVAFQVNNTLTGDGGKLSIDLTFECLEDFSPARVAQKVDSLRTLMQARTQLAALLTSLDGNSDAKELIDNVLRDQNLLVALASQRRNPDDVE